MLLKLKAFLLIGNIFNFLGEIVKGQQIPTALLLINSPINE